MTMRFIMRPDTKYGYSFNVVGSKDLTYGTRKDYASSKSVLETLRKLRASKAPIELVDPNGLKIYGYISSITETLVERQATMDMGNLQYDFSIGVSFVEV
jgi:hypothetical protein